MGIGHQHFKVLRTVPWPLELASSTRRISCSRELGDLLTTLCTVRSSVDHASLWNTMITVVAGRPVRSPDFLWHLHTDSCTNALLVGRWGGSCLSDWFTGWLKDCLIGWLADQQADWLTGYLTEWLLDRLLGLLPARLTDWLIDWLIDWLVDLLTDHLTA
jgi:hypothetical protein